jgi:hypothetical protein
VTCLGLRHMNLRILTLSMLPVAASAQLLTFGVQGSVPAQQPISRSENMPFAIGPTVGVRISSGLSFESGLLYHRIGRGSNFGTFFGPENSITLSSESWRGHALEVPFLAKYRFRNERSALRPFVTAGPTLRRTTVDSVAGSSIFSGSSLSSIGHNISGATTTKWNLDPTFGVGADLRTGRFHTEPMVRYSYWAAGKNWLVRKNQVDFLLGFRF